MIQVSRKDYKEMVKSGFRFRYPTTKTAHNRYRYVVDNDYEAYLKFLENKNKGGN